ncbi:MAG: LysM domain-containing protein [Rhodanobacter sp.]
MIALRTTCQQQHAFLALLLSALLLGGCAQVGQLKSRIGTRAPPAGASAASAPHAATPAAAPTLAAIINDDLQRGRYAAGEQALRRYLAQHPDDRAAQATLRQLTADPRQVLGRASRAHVVQPGDSYSTLAARYLGDASQFLILARYNNSTDPSLLRVGESVQLPLSAAGAVEAAPQAEAAPPVPESTSTKVRRLQAESLALLKQGDRKQALQRMDAALTLDPRLKLDPGSVAASLRKDVLAGYHQRAIVLYRDQQLDPAIALWDRVLAIDPGYEPATVYRTRALELKQRLKQY